MDERIIVITSNSSSSDSYDTEVLMAYANGLKNPSKPPNYDLVRGMCSVNNPHFLEPHIIWAYSPQSSASGESIIQPVNDPSRVLNYEPPMYVEMVRKSPENPLDSNKTEPNPGRKLMKNQLLGVNSRGYLKNMEE
jgi:hypothetical protein